MTLRVALVGGPMYDHLYAHLPDGVEVVVHADHPTLNREVAAMLAAGERIDVLSTHSKYAPSQRELLTPLDGVVAGEAVDALAPRAVDLCRFDGDLLCVPRNIDVRVLWYRTDVVADPPATWAAVLDGSHAFGFPGRESGLFGTFFELVAGRGDGLFDADLRPTLTGPACEDAVETLCRLAAKAPPDLPDWHYDQVDAALLDGRVAMAAAWPGGYGPIRASATYERLAPAPYPAGPQRRVSYAGCHAWGIPRTCGDLPGAVALVERLCSRELGDAEAAGGAVCAHVDAFASVEPADGTDARRLVITRDTIADGMITYPPLSRFPEIEDAAWGAIRRALLGELSAGAACAAMQRVAEEVLGR